MDASNPACKEQMNTVYSLLNELDVKDKPIITVFNKIDKDIVTPLPHDPHADTTIRISAKYDTNTDKLLEAVEDIVKSFRTSIKVNIPYSDGKLLNLVHKNCEIISEEHSPSGTIIEAYVNEEYRLRLQKYSV